MRDIESRVGLGFELHVDTNNRGFDQLHKALGGKAIELADWGNLHVTLIDCEETAFAVNSIRDQRALDDARAVCGDFLSSIVKEGIVLTPVSSKLERFGRRNRSIGIPLTESRMLSEYRSELGELMYDTAGVSISSQRAFRPHITLGSKIKQGGQVNAQRLPVPRRIVVDGFNVNERKSNVWISVPGSRRHKMSERRVIRRNPAATTY